MDDRFTNLAGEYWQWKLKNTPEFATAVGDHRYDDCLSDYSLKAYTTRLNDVKCFLSKLGGEINYDQLTEENKVNFDFLHHEMKTIVDGSQYNCHLFPINALEGPYKELLLIIGWMKKDKKEDYEKIISRLEKFQNQADQVIELLKEGIKTGYINSKVSMKPVPEQIKNMLDTPAQKSSFFEPFRECSEQNIKEKALQTITDKVYPALSKIHDFIEQTYIPACRANISCTSLPSGTDFYAAVLKFHITVNMTTDEVHQTGLSEVSRIRKRMNKIMKEVGFVGTLEEFFEHLRKDPQFYHSDKDELLGMYRSTGAKIKLMLPKYFASIPKAECVIKELPAEGAASAPGAFYYAGTADGSRPGTFFVNTYDVASRPDYEVVNLSLHEANPGHHHQASIAMEQKHLPSFRQFIEDRCYYEAPARSPINTAYVEGWGLYAEYLGEEMGLYDTPYKLFGRLSAEMFRACRLVVDTGMHVKAWTHEQAVDYLTKNTAMSLGDIAAEVDRYITWPGQACGYKIGEIKIRELREKAEEQLGDRFDLRLFHDAILKEGAVSLSLLEKMVDTFINNHKK